MPHVPTAAAVAPDGKRLAIAYEDQRLRIHNADSGITVSDLGLIKRTCRALSFIDNGAALVMGDDEGIQVRDAVTGMTLSAEKSRFHRLRQVIIPSDERTLILAFDSEMVYFADPVTCHFRYAVSDGSYVDTLSLSPDGLTLATGNRRGEVRLFRASEP